MPYKIEKKGDKFALVKKDTGEVVALHDSKEKAHRQAMAIYANENQKK